MALLDRRKAEKWRNTIFGLMPTNALRFWLGLLRKEKHATQKTKNCSKEDLFDAFLAKLQRTRRRHRAFPLRAARSARGVRKRIQAY